MDHSEINTPHDQNGVASNQTWWDERAKMHSQSDFYGVQGLISGESRLNDYEIAEVGDVTGKKLIQLQCHIGTETVSWARLGAVASGLDFSAASIAEAEEIAHQCDVDITYHVADVYDAPEVAGKHQYDVVYVSGGSLHWLPDITKWGKTIEQLLVPGGRLYMNLFHPISAVLAEYSPTFERDYFDGSAELWNDSGSYTDAAAETVHNDHVVWDRPLSDIFTAIIDAGMDIRLFRERPGQEYQQFPYQEKRRDGRWYNPAQMGVHPSTFSIMAIRRQLETTL